MSDNTRQHYKLATGEGVKGYKKGGKVCAPMKKSKGGSVERRERKNDNG